MFRSTVKDLTFVKVARDKAARRVVTAQVQPVYLRPQVSSIHQDHFTLKPAALAPSFDTSSGDVPQKCTFDTERAYSKIPTYKLLRAWGVLKLCSFSPLVRNSEKLLEFSSRVFGKHFVKRMIKPTFFLHFCAGENEHEIKPTIQFLQSNGIGSILDFAAESDIHEIPKSKDHMPHISGPNGTNLSSPKPPVPKHHSPVKPRVLPKKGKIHRNRTGFEKARVYDYTTEKECDHNARIFEKAIKAVHNNASEGFAAIKLTALGNPKLLESMSTAQIEIRELFGKFDEDQDGKISKEEFIHGYKKFFKQDKKGRKVLDDLLQTLTRSGEEHIDIVDWISKLSFKTMAELADQCIEPGPFRQATLGKEEIHLVDKMLHRAEHLAQTAAKLNVALLIDAEHSYFQPAIDHITVTLQRKYNKQNACIYNTYQCYLKETNSKIKEHISRSERENWNFACKLVRGAYMVLERRRAMEMGYPSPIHDTIEDTHTCFNDAMNLIMSRDNVAKFDESCNIMIATHNQESIEKAVAIMGKNHIRKDQGVYFAQLYGMGDHLTFSLGLSGFKAYKYLPYGPVHEVLPYLIRRAQENSSMLAGATEERNMIKRELIRRMI
mmetsp:Transcript_1737/g.1984  ORF Transcript_1737/g.1984 Transcript_1737/m.1984 type:complete len:607 (-) Transcript_1737:1354-3174(-)